MSSETQSHSRKRRDRKKKKGDSDPDKLDARSFQDVNDEDDSCKDDLDEHDAADTKSHHDDHSHGPPSSFLSTVIFFLLLGGLVVLTSMIFLELKGSKEVGPPISESRYASILGDFVEEHSHDDDDHDAPQMYVEDDEHEHEEVEHFAEEGGGGEGEVHEEPESVSETFEQTEDPPASADAEANEEEGRTEEDVVEDDDQLEDSTLKLDIADIGVNHGGGDEPEQEMENEELPENEELEGEVERGDDQYTEQEADDGNIQDTEQEVDDGNIQDTEQEVEREEHRENVEEEQEEEREDAEETAGQEVKNVEEREAAEETKEQDAEQEVEHAEREAEEDGRANEENPIEERIEIEPEEPVDEQPSVEDEVTADVREEVSEDSSLPLVEEVEGREDEVRQGQEEEEEEAAEADVRTESPSDDITDPYDYEFREELDAADSQLENAQKAEQTVVAKASYEDILRRHPASPRALYGIAKSYDKLSEQQNSNALLEQSIHSYQEVLRLPNLTDALYRRVGERCVDRMRFRGFIEKATRIQTSLIRRFPRDSSLRNQLAVSYLLLGQSQLAKKVLEEVLGDFPADGFAKVHMGFILKTTENNNKEAIRFLQEGIETQEPGTLDGRFYFHLGDALSREGHADSAVKVYEDGVRKGLFLSVFQRSLYNVDELVGRPWWTAEETTYGDYLKQLEDSWEMIRDEGLALLDESKGGFLPETENLRDTGTWKQFEIYSRGKKIAANCVKAPRTCKLIEGIPDAAGCKRGQVKFSIMHPGTHVWAHTGPTNCRLRAHLGLVVPDGVKIRVANETRFWKEGQFIVFDDSFEHEVWHTGSSIRLVLIVDFWHPELSRFQKESLSAI